MRTIANTESIELEVSPDELINDKWINCAYLSKKIRDYEKAHGLDNRYLCNRFYNSVGSGRYLTATVAGLRCIDINSPMLKTASLEISFKRK